MVNGGKRCKEEKHFNNSLQQVVIEPLWYKTKYLKVNLPSNIICFKIFTIQGIYGVSSFVSLLWTLTWIFNLEYLFHGRKTRSLLYWELAILQHSRKLCGIWKTPEPKQPNVSAQ